MAGGSTSVSQGALFLGFLSQILKEVVLLDRFSPIQLHSTFKSIETDKIKQAYFVCLSTYHFNFTSGL